MAGFDVINMEISEILAKDGVSTSGILALTFIVGACRTSGFCWINGTRFARSLGMTSRGWRKLRDELKKRGYIAVQSGSFGTGSKSSTIMITAKTKELWFPLLENNKRNSGSSETEPQFRTNGTQVPHNKQRTNKEQRPADEPRTRYGGRGSPVIKNDEGVPIL